MNDNIFTEIINAWKFLSQSEKINILQRFECELSKMEGRTEREIVFDPIKNDLEAEFKFNEPNKLFLHNLKSPMSAMNSVVHEGFHAEVRRFLADEANLEVLSEINEAQFFYEEQLMDIFYYLCAESNLLDVFKTCFYEEVLAQENTTLRLMDLLYNSAENSDDLLKLAPTYTNEILFRHYNYTQYVQSNCFDIYHRVLLNKACSLANSDLADHVRPITTNKDIIQSDNEPLRQQFVKNMQVTKNFHRGKLNERKVAQEIFQNMIEYRFE